MESVDAFRWNSITDDSDQRISDYATGAGLSYPRQSGEHLETVVVSATAAMNKLKGPTRHGE